MILKRIKEQYYIIKQYTLILKKGSRPYNFYKLIINILHVLVQLSVNQFFFLKLKLYKYEHKIKKPIVHYYAVCWNEEKILPFMLDYYSQFVDNFFIYDNHSTDNSIRILSEQKKVEVIKFQTDNTFNDIIHTDIKNECWKKSRGRADFVIVCDVDEFLYHPQITDFLSKCLEGRYSFFTLKGYNMYASTFPQYNSQKLLVDIIQNGIFDKLFCKSIIFDPHKIIEINYSPGSHVCYPWGIVKTKVEDELLLLHYKNLGIDYVLGRYAMYRNRLSQINIEKDYGVEYLQEDEKTANEIEFNIVNSKRII